MKNKCNEVNYVMINGISVMNCGKVQVEGDRWGLTELGVVLNELSVKASLM